MLASMRLGRFVVTACGMPRAVNYAAVLLHFFHFFQALRQAAAMFLLY